MLFIYRSANEALDIHCPNSSCPEIIPNAMVNSANLSFFKGHEADGNLDEPCGVPRKRAQTPPCASQLQYSHAVQHSSTTSILLVHLPSIMFMYY